MLSRKVQSYIAKEQLLTPGDHVILAVSGGKDSMAMLHALHALSNSLGITLSAAHMNHGLRGEESRRDAEFVSRYCAANNIPCTVEEADAAAYAETHGLGIEEAARTLRYRFLEALDPTAKIATAHTAEDNLETVLMHLLRGSGLHGLTGIPPRRGRIIRPLLSVSRREIEAYLAEHSIPHVEDSTNALDDCLRNRLRHNVLPLLAAENPRLSEQITLLTETLRREDAFLQSEAAARLSEAADGKDLSLDVLLSQPPAIQYRILAQFLSPVNGLSRRHLDDALALCLGASPSARLSLPGGCTLRREYRVLRLVPAQEDSILPEPLTIPGEGVYPFGFWEITCRRGPAPKTLPADTVTIAAENLTKPITLRPYRPGDRICLSGGTKKLSRLYMDCKIPAALRPCLPVAVLGDTVLAALPLKTAAAYQPRPGEDCLLLQAIKLEV